jgi:hypothetical protein
VADSSALQGCRSASIATPAPTAAWCPLLLSSCCCCFSCCCCCCCCRKREEAKHKAVALPPAVAKWLKASGAADVALSGISWAKVLQPNKKVSLELACAALLWPVFGGCLHWRRRLHSIAVLSATVTLRCFSCQSNSIYYHPCCRASGGCPKPPLPTRSS